MRLAKKVNELLARPYLIAGQEVHTSSSIGITVFPADGDQPDQLLRNADMAMYRAKLQGRGGFQFYSKELHTLARDRMAIEKDLRRAIQMGEFLLHYQPQICLQSGKILGMEALIRWNHPIRGLVLPIEFIPVAEDSGLIVEIGKWVIHEACRQTKIWQACGLPELRVSANISAVQFRNADLYTVVARALESSALDASYLELEITESVLMENDSRSRKTLERFHNLGIQLSLDDFGTGYSSLSYLKSFPMDTIKIDRSFIRDIHTDPDDTAIVRAIVGLGQALNLSVIAEGVETKEQERYLVDQGCRIAQGYLYSKPMGVIDVVRFIEKYKQTVAPCDHLKANIPIAK